jgi:hypothetical protein
MSADNITLVTMGTSTGIVFCDDIINQPDMPSAQMLLTL